ncbi:hypothetical protein BIFLAC_03852 [Bifidobacterium animalis subsp. lactis HN019]|uniref:Uncharacterized protein n=1 Tax=Bifidobacterium animalis subsp. lactis CNCM I-2494 TaxID=1042403 RepID=A0A806FHD1_BIFAN|nr:hypothetical protein Balac_0705 [Bifidobacterium animalis subsp. lactis Bl-04]ACS47645.1 hypothetical protein Balat_0705 [Bifidobacterium animalis subsp. lactis DSM 10140]ADG33270.1 hypothetical protein BalV_0682 [Bifidobacterium animalis subsp. lactis V9]AEK30165.1 hypothetical protein BALAC2494_01936 [Bifidobacterium animalis subsp. lactis CNCM I-2494]AFJ16446.1 hypothetical protein W7Y_0709 [Bifidobacterium animalis subsp. lactis B420]AIA32723.1 hypothetical protein EN10_03585 [Bifidobac
MFNIESIKSVVLLANLPVSAPAMLSSVLETFPEQADMLRTHAMTAIKDGMLRVLFIHAPLQNGKPNTMHQLWPMFGFPRW